MFSLGSLLAALAPNYELLLGARVVQALGGAALPGLGMTLASRAFGPGNRGAALGALSATMGSGAAIGPLLGGTMSAQFGWQSLFVITALAVLVTPLALAVLPKAEERSREPMDVAGGLLLAVMLTGLLLAASEGGQSGWGSPLVLGSAGLAGAALLLLGWRQRSAVAPFLPRELLGAPRYLGLVGTSFTAMTVNLGLLVALPLVLTTTHNLSIGEVGLVLLPGAAASAVLGLVAGRLVDKIGARLPVRLGISLMLLATLGLSTFIGSEIWQITIFVVALGAGFTLLNTPIAAVVSQTVRAPMLPSALSINTMVLFLGGSFSTVLLTLILAERGSPAVGTINPLHSGGASGFSDAFLILALPMLVAMVLSLSLPEAPEKPADEAAIEADKNRNWVPNCSVPWMPACQEGLQAGVTSAVEPPPPVASPPRPVAST